MKSYNVWVTLAWDDVRGKYHRTVLGPIWLVLAQAIWMGGIVLIFSGVFKQEVRVFAVYLSSGLAIWIFISTVMTESVTIFIRAKGILSSYDLPVSLHVFRTVLTQLIILGHHLVVYVLLVIIFYNPINLNTLFIIPAIIIILTFALGVSLILGIAGARFRDVSPAVQSIVNLLFIFTPIFWQKTMLGSKTLVTDFNIFFHYVDIFRSPLMGEVVSPLSWLVTAITSVLVLGAGILIFARYRTNIYYWL